MDTVDPLLAELVESLSTTPAVVVNERWDVIASNPLAHAISPSFSPGVNLAEAVFDSQSSRRTLPQWNEVSARMVGLLKEAMADPDERGARVEELRSHLAQRSADFTRAWSEGGLPEEYGLVVPMDHPTVGRIDISYELLRVPGVSQTLVLGHVEPGSISEERLFELAAGIEPT